MTAKRKMTDEEYDVWLEKFDPELADHLRKKKALLAELAAAFAVSPAVIIDSGRGRETLVLHSAEPYDSKSGGMRMSYFGHDGPNGHTTRPTLGKLIQEIDELYTPKSFRVATDDDVMAWTATEEFQLGVERVAQVMKANEQGHRR